MVRWKYSQQEVERALSGGSLTVKQLVHKTGLSHNTVRAALDRCAVIDRDTWPPTYSFSRSAMTREDKASTEVITEYVPIVEPVEYSTDRVGAIWRDERQYLVKGIIAMDPEVMDLPTLQEKLKSLVAQSLGLYLALAEVKDGPDWRDQVGLT